MNPNLTPEDRLYFIKRIAEIAPISQDLHKEMYDKADKYILDKDIKSLFGLSSYPDMDDFITSAQSRCFFLLLKILSDEISTGFTENHLFSYNSSKEALDEYRKIIFLLRRIEIFDPSSEEVSSALIQLKDLELSPYWYSVILENELFEAPEEIAVIIYHNLIENLSAKDKVSFLLTFARIYESPFWYIHLANVFIETGDTDTATKFLHECKKPDASITEALKILENRNE